LLSLLYFVLEVAVARIICEEDAPRRIGVVRNAPVEDVMFGCVGVHLDPIPNFIQDHMQRHVAPE
jgi:hypothetical protein